MSKEKKVKKEREKKTHGTEGKIKEEAKGQTMTRNTASKTALAAARNMN